MMAELAAVLTDHLLVLQPDGPTIQYDVSFAAKDGQKIIHHD